MRLLLVLSLIAAAGAAHADAKRKAKPDKFEKAAGEAFAEAMALEDAGKDREALAAYRRSFEIVPHPSTAFNIAELLLRTKQMKDVILMFELYLVLQPKAADRAYVEAAINEVMTRPLVHPLPLSSLDGLDTSKAFVVVDGKVVRKPGAATPLQVDLAPGFHSIDHVTPITFDARYVTVRPGGYGSIEAHGNAKGKPRAAGNVMIRANDQGDHLDVRFRGEKVNHAARITAPPGTYRVAVSDRDYECSPITIVVPKNEDHVVYVHVSTVELPVLPMSGVTPKRCRKLAVQTQVLAFE